MSAQAWYATGAIPTILNFATTLLSQKRHPGPSHSSESLVWATHPSQPSESLARDGYLMPGPNLLASPWSKARSPRLVQARGPLSSAARRGALPRRRKHCVRLHPAQSLRWRHMRAAASMPDTMATSAAGVPHVDIQLPPAAPPCQPRIACHGAARPDQDIRAESQGIRVSGSKLSRSRVSESLKLESLVFNS